MARVLKFSLQNLKRIAASKLTQVDTYDDVVEYFKILFCKRYNLPFKSEVLKEYTPYELMLEIMILDFLDDKKSLNDFIRKDNGEIDAIMEDDEKWFKEQMGDSYTTEDYRSEEYIKQMEAINKRKEAEIDDLPDGEYDF